MSIKPADLDSGQTFSLHSFYLNADYVADYMDSVSDSFVSLTETDSTGFAPPMALAALSLKGVIHDLEITPGTLHTGQDMEFKRPVRIGESLKCTASVVKNSFRGGSRFLAIQFSVEDSEHRQVMVGKSMLMLPE